MGYNGSGLAMWRYSVFGQPGPLPNKVTTVDDMFCSRALFVSRNWRRVANKKLRICSSFRH